MYQNLLHLKDISSQFIPSFLPSFVHSFIHISEGPQLRSSPTKQVQTYGRCSRIPTRTEGLRRMGCGLVPQGDRLGLCCHYSSAMQPSTPYLPPWLGYTRALLASVCHTNPLRGVPSTPVSTSCVTQGTDLHVTLRYGRDVGFMGGRLVGAEFIHSDGWTDVHI